MSRQAPKLFSKLDSANGWLETLLVCPFCGSKYGPGFANKKPTFRAGVLMKIGGTEKTEYRCGECEEKFILYLADDIRIGA